MVQVFRDRSPQDFLRKARGFLYANEPSNSLVLGLSENLMLSPPQTPPLLLRVVENRQVMAAAIQTPPMSLLLTPAAAPALEKLAKYIKSLGAQLPGVVGPAEETAMFAEMWARVSGRGARLAVRQKIYKLEKVKFPAAVDGEIRTARNEDVKVILEWTRAFAKEALGESDQRSARQWRELVEKDILAKKSFLWISEGRAVAMAATRRPTKNGASISSVYTPLEHRRKGYASSLVAHLSQRLLDSGKKFCVLYTDLANSTSNKIYRDVGYLEESDSSHYMFS